MITSTVATRIAWITAIGLVATQALVEYWKKMYVGPDKAVAHGLAMLAIVAVFQLGIIFAPYVFRRAAKWRLLTAALMAPVLLSLGYLIFWHVTMLHAFVESLPIPPAVWATQLVVLPLGVLGYIAVLLHLGWPNSGMRPRR